MSSLRLVAVGISSVAHTVDLAIITGVGVASSGLDAVGFNSSFVSVDAIVSIESVTESFLVNFGVRPQDIGTPVDRCPSPGAVVVVVIVGVAVLRGDVAGEASGSDRQECQYLEV